MNLTGYERDFYGVHIPRIAKALEKQNELLEVMTKQQEQQNKLLEERNKIESDKLKQLKGSF